MKPNNPPAFPSPTAPGIYGTWGMTLRDYFAAAALPAVIAHLEVNLGDAKEAPEDCLYLGAGAPDLILVAEYSYAVADAMLAHRLPVEAYPQPAEFGSTENSGKAP